MEEWRKINHTNEFNHEYEVSNLGRVRNIKNGRILKPFDKGNGYYQIAMGRRKKITLHRLVAVTFIPNPENKPEVNHKNGVKTDNRVENLEWCTSEENNNHSVYVLGNQSKSNGRKESTYTPSRGFMWEQRRRDTGELVGVYKGRIGCSKATGYSLRKIMHIVNPDKGRRGHSSTSEFIFIKVKS